MQKDSISGAHLVWQWQVTPVIKLFMEMGEDLALRDANVAHPTKNGEAYLLICTTLQALETGYHGIFLCQCVQHL
jgi:hypothetical protein